MPETPLRSALSTSRATRAGVDVAAQVVGGSGRCRGRAARRARRDRVGCSASWWSSSSVVHLPEGALLGRRLGGLGRQLRVRVHVGERQVAPHVAQVVAEVGEQLADDRLGLAAVGALEVAVLDQRDRGVRRAADVVAGRGRPARQVDQRLGRADQLRGRGARRAASIARKTAHETSGGAAPRQRARRAFASSSSSPSNARPAISSATVKPMPATAPPPASAPPGDRRLQPPAVEARRRATARRGCRAACRRRSRRRCRA